MLRALLFVRLLHPIDVAGAQHISIQASELCGKEMAAAVWGDAVAWRDRSAAFMHTCMWKAAPTCALQHAANTQYTPLPLPHLHTRTRQAARSRTAMIAAARARASRDLGRDLLAEDAEASGPVERAMRCLCHVTSAGAIHLRCDICGSDPPNTMAHCINHKTCTPSSFVSTPAF